MILISGAGGHLGRLVAERLAHRDDVVLGTRDPNGSGAAARRIDFDDPATLGPGFDEVTTLLLISAGYAEDDVVIRRHGAAIDAAERAGVRTIVYTSLSAAGDHLTYALAHRWTERRLSRSPIPSVVLRNGLYTELLLDLTAPGDDGVITAPLGTGRLAAVAREDLADVAARVTADAPVHAGRTYELVGTEAIGAEEVAAQLSQVRGRPVTYRPATLAETRTALEADPAFQSFQVPMVCSTYSAIAGGFLAETGGDLPELLGRPPRPLSAVRHAALAAG
ncbi:NAD(P)H-binding protein [Actinoplanes sp. NPDC049596]|uniref:NAD(P)H-binding protein n=1 Tax=unclassified Actinoplanes TaxID=2626549 RepID=UPI0034313C52